MASRLLKPLARCGLGRVSAARGFSTSKDVRILTSDMDDIVFHFCVEEYLMNHAKVSAPLLYLWRPSKVVTIGRHQNPWKECKLAELEADGVALERRRSGGGCVFQDAGCSVFTFIAPSGVFNIDRNLDIVLGSLRRLGINGEKKGRNDLVHEGKKISGSAFRHAPDRGVSLHHGTVLVDTDMTALGRYLTPDKRKLQAKGIASVGARVMNLKDAFPSLDHASLCEAFMAEFREVENGAQATVEVINEQSAMVQEPEFQRIRDELKSDDWRLGRTPEFSHQLETRIDGVGIFDVRLEVLNGKVKEAVIFSDALFPDVIDEAMRVLVDVDYGRRGFRSALEPLRNQFTEPGPSALIDAFTNWLTENVED